MLTTTSTKVNEKDSFHFIMQNKLIDRIDVLDEIGCIELLPNTNLSTTKQVADFYGVDADVVRMLILNFRELLRKDGFKTCGAKEIIEMMNNESPEKHVKLTKGKGGYYLDGEFLIPYCKSGVFTKRAVLRVGMMLTESEVAERVRGKLINESSNISIEEFCVPKKKEQQMELEIVSEPIEEKVETNEIVIIQNNQAVTTSLQVAEVFKKQHAHVLRDIEDLLGGISKIGDTPMFHETTYEHPQNKQQYRIFYMNRDGFTLLAMGFTGKKALQFKLKYIEQFNLMEEQLKNQAQPQVQATPSYMIENPIERAEQWILEEKERIRLQELVEQQAKELEKKKVLSITTHKEHQKKCDILRNIVRTGCNDETDAMKRWNFLYKHFESMYNIEARLLRKAYIAETGYDITIMGYIDKMLNMLDELLDTAKKVFPYETDEVLGNQFEIDFFIN